MNKDDISCEHVSVTVEEPFLGANIAEVEVGVTWVNTVIGGICLKR
jgi:hypothetical protein